MAHNDLIRTLILLAVINALIVVAFFMKKITRLSDYVPRKFLHITAISVAAYSFVYIGNEYYLIALGVLILFGNYFIYKKEIFEKNDPEYKNFGVFFVPISYLILIFTMNEHRSLAMFAMFVMALADAGAAIIGENIPVMPYKLGNAQKSISGSLTFAFITLLILNVALFTTIDGKIFFSVEPVYKIWAFLFFSTLILTVSEALSTKGVDNIAVPLLSGFFLMIFFTHPQAVAPGSLLIGVIFAVLLLLFSFKLKFLTTDGSFTAFILGAFVFGLGGLKWSVPLLTFFILSSLLSKVKKNNHSDAFEKGDKRDSLQVLANGGLPALLMMLNLVQPDAIWFVLYLTSLATSMADTWATETGNFKERPTFWILNFEKIEQGISGGISLGGTIGAIAGASILALSGIYWIGAYKWLIFAVVAIGGVLGMIIDSLLGATLQRKNKCVVCSKETEKKLHCNKPTEYHSGIKFINNDFVNFISSFVVVVLVYFLLR